MAGRIAKLLQRPTPERPDVAAAAQQLGALAEEQPDLRQAAALQTDLLRAIYAAPAPVEPLELAPEDAAAKLAGGVPLLRNVALPFQERDLRAVFARLCDALEATTKHTKSTKNNQDTSILQNLRDLRGSTIDLWSLASALLAGEPITTQLEEQGQPAELTSTLLRLSLLPFLEQVAAQLVPARAAHSWKRGYCPACGAWPILAEQRGLEQFRYLRCGLCASAWEVDRVWCPFCDERNHLLLGYLHVEGEEQRQRAATCDACRSYLKVRSTLSPLTTPQLLAEEVALVHLDLIAAQKGYAPPA